MLKSTLLIKKIIYILLLSYLTAGCATPVLVVKVDPSLSLEKVKSVFVLPFESLDQNREAEITMFYAFKDQLKYDGIFKVVEDPELADAYFKGTVGKWSRGGADIGGAKSTEISGNISLLNKDKKQIWFVSAEQFDPARILASGVFSRSPSALASLWARNVLQKMPGYKVKGSPEEK